MGTRVVVNDLGRPTIEFFHNTHGDQLIMTIFDFDLCRNSKYVHFKYISLVPNVKLFVAFNHKKKLTGFLAVKTLLL